MNTPHKCPICQGRGEITQAKAKHDAVPVHSSIKNGKPHKIFMCHGCNGTGLIWEYNLTWVQPYPFPGSAGGGSISSWNANNSAHYVGPIDQLTLDAVVAMGSDNAQEE